jgi:hypothetical protein
MEQIKHFINIGKNAKIKHLNVITGVISILIALWAIFYAIPNLFITLFYTLLGNIVLLFGVILIGMFHPGAALLVSAIIVVLYKISLHNASIKEGIETMGAPATPPATATATTTSTVAPPATAVAPIATSTTASAVTTPPSTMSNYLTSVVDTISSNIPMPIRATPPAATTATAPVQSAANIINRQWSKATVDKFLEYQKSRYPTAQFNMEIIQNQATEQEALTLIQTGFWPWTKPTQDMYVNSIVKSQVIKIAPDESLTESMKLYNENAIKLMLSWNTKEGQLLLMGADLGASTYDPLFAGDKNHNIIKCRAPTSAKTDPVSYMEKTSYLGTDYLSGIFKTKKEIVANADLPTVIPGFGFIKGTCNPCGPLNIQPDYGCPFNLNVKGDNSVSEIWQSLWNLK